MLEKEPREPRYPSREIESRILDCPAVVLVTDFEGNSKEHLGGAQSDAALCRLVLINELKSCLRNPEMISVNDIYRHSIVNAAFIFCRLAKVAPEGTVFIGVVDPGVGTERKSVIIQTEKKHFFVGPDNGIFYPAAIGEIIEQVWRIGEAKFHDVSTTFHGRDIFTPVAAGIAKGVSLNSFGSRIDE